MSDPKTDMSSKAYFRTLQMLKKGKMILFKKRRRSPKSDFKAVSTVVLEAEPRDGPVFPAEILLQIWIHMLPEPCFVGTKWDSKCNLKFWKARGAGKPIVDHEHFWNYFRADQPVPVVLHINRASREEFTHQSDIARAHPTYQLCNMSPMDENLVHLDFGNSVYVDPHRDMLVMNTREVLEEESISCIRHLGLRVHFKCNISTPRYPTQSHVCQETTSAFDHVPYSWRRALESVELKRVTLVLPELKDMLSLRQKAVHPSAARWFGADIPWVKHHISSWVLSTTLRKTIENGTFSNIVCGYWKDLLLEGQPPVLSAAELLPAEIPAKASAEVSPPGGDTSGDVSLGEVQLEEVQLTELQPEEVQSEQHTPEGDVSVGISIEEEHTHDDHALEEGTSTPETMVELLEDHPPASGSS